MRRVWQVRNVGVGLVLCVALVALSGCKRKTKVGPATILYLVRHAEKAKDGTHNPPLTKTGHKRALALARMFHSVPLHAIYATQYKRTQQTASPTANAKRLPVKIMKAGKEKALLAVIKRQFRGKSVLISGHSNTIPAMIKALGGPASLKLKERTDYDDVFVLVWRNGLAPTYLRFHVGPMPPK